MKKKMRIKMKTLAAGPEGVLAAGREVDVDRDLALQLIAGGYAEPVGKEVEMAVAEPPPEKATTPKRRKRRTTKKADK